MFFKKQIRQYQIWHLIDEQFSDTLSLLQHGAAPAQAFVETHTYQYVATIQTTSIKHVRSLVVHHNHNWLITEHVVHRANENVRSTTVGDIIIDLSTNFPYFYCQFGWTAIDGFKPI